MKVLSFIVPIPCQQVQLSAVACAISLPVQSGSSHSSINAVMRSDDHRHHHHHSH